MLNAANTETYGWEAAIRGMRNPMNSWEKSDSFFHLEDNSKEEYRKGVCIGPNDLGLMKKLRNAGTDHRKFMRMIVVYVDITAPLYWWKEFDTYKVGTVANSCSTMHKLTSKPFTFKDFSCEHLDTISMRVLSNIITYLNQLRESYLKNNDKTVWWQMIQLLPTSYNQTRTVMLNYEVLAGIYPSRKNHKLDEWHTFCKWIEELPDAKGLIIGDEQVE